MVLKGQAFCYSCSSHKGALLSNDWGLQFGTDSVCQDCGPTGLHPTRETALLWFAQYYHSCRDSPGRHMTGSHCTWLCWPSLFILPLNCFLECFQLCVASFLPFLYLSFVSRKLIPLRVHNYLSLLRIRHMCPPRGILAIIMSISLGSGIHLSVFSLFSASPAFKMQHL